MMNLKSSKFYLEIVIMFSQELHTAYPQPSWKVLLHLHDRTGVQVAEQGVRAPHMDLEDVNL